MSKSGLSAMDDSIPSISTGTVGSRFVSSNDIETAKARRDEQWKAAYARQETTNPYAARADRNILGWVKNPLLSQ
jgi:hypothetical protein